MINVAQFIERHGAKAISEATGISTGAIYVWKHRERIPRTAWPELLLAYPDELSIDDLKRMEAPDEAAA